jgi:hypothetical protein
MTGVWGASAAEAAFLSLALYAALKGRSSTVLHGSVRAASKINVKIKVKGSGLGRPPYTSS